jgi:predicted RNA binding protein YcfA (HicA-like mRNA interferase family)
MTQLPAITGKQFIKLLQKDGWTVGRKANHGITMTKYVQDRTLVTFIPDTRASLIPDTLYLVLGTRQTKIGRNGLLALIEKYGL